MSRDRPGISWLGALLVLWAVAGQGASPPVGRAILHPRQETYYVGQTVRLVLELEIADSELGGNLSVEGLSDIGWATFGDFAEMAGETRSSDGRLLTVKRFATDMRLMREGTFELALALGGSTAERLRRGFMTVLSHTPFHVPLPRMGLSVQPLPPGPADFCGAIGSFRLSARLEPAQASPGDLVNLLWSLEGTGNLDGFHLPAYDAGGDVRAYPPTEEARGPGRVVVRQVLVPQTLEATRLPALELSVFDPVAGRYVPLAAGPFALGMVPRSERPVEAPAVPMLTPTVAAPETGGSSVAASPMVFPQASQLPPLFAMLAGVAVAVVLFVAVVQRSAWAAVVLAALAVAGGWTVRQALLSRAGRDSLTLPEAIETRLCPASTARVLAHLPAGASVRVLEQSGQWLRVEYQGASGWIPQRPPSPGQDPVPPRNS